MTTKHLRPAQCDPRPVYTNSTGGEIKITGHSMNLLGTSQKINRGYLVGRYSPVLKLPNTWTCWGKHKQTPTHTHRERESQTSQLIIHLVGIMHAMNLLWTTTCCGMSLKGQSENNLLFQVLKETTLLTFSCVRKESCPSHN